MKWAESSSKTTPLAPQNSDSNGPQSQPLGFQTQRLLLSLKKSFTTATASWQLGPSTLIFCPRSLQHPITSLFLPHFVFFFLHFNFSTAPISGFYGDPFLTGIRVLSSISLGFLGKHTPILVGVGWGRCWRSCGSGDGSLFLICCL